METHQFWAFFVIAIIAGVALTFAVNDGLTGNATFWERIGLTKQTTATTEITVPRISPIRSTTTEGNIIQNNAIKFNTNLASSILSGEAYGHLGKWMTVFSDIYTYCYDIFKDKEYCLAFTQSAWQSGLSEAEAARTLAVTPGTIPDVYAPAAEGGAAYDGGAGASTDIEIEDKPSPCPCGGVSCVTCICSYEDYGGPDQKCVSCRCK